MQNVVIGMVCGVMGHPRSQKCHHSIQTMHLSCTIFESYRVICQVANFNLHHLHLGWPTGGDLVPILHRSLASENYSPRAIVHHCLHDPTFSDFDTISACDRQMDRRTHNNS